MIYLDYQATTPVDSRVLDAMLPWFTANFGNAASVQHSYGRASSEAVERARRQVASLLGCSPGEVIFTSGATESSNLALAGIARAALPERRHIISSPIEHKSVLDPLARLARDGFPVSWVRVDRDGAVDLDHLDSLLGSNTLLVSLMAANNEIGTLAPMKTISNLVHAKGAILHTDAAQYFGKLPVDVYRWGVDVLSLSAHKIYGPKGMGALYVRRGVPIEPMMLGGGHENGLRSGTLNSPACVGLGEAAAIASTEMDGDARRAQYLATEFMARVRRAIPEVQLLGRPTDRLPGNLNIRIPGVDADDLMVVMPNLAVSTGSACSAASPSPSHVLRALGLSYAEAQECVRIGFGRFSLESDADDGAELLIAAVRRLTSQRNREVASR